MQLVTFRNYLCCLSLMTPCIAAMAESCQDKVNSSGAYVYSHSLPVGNGVIECYVRAKDGSGEPIKDSVVFEDSLPNAPAETTNDKQTSNSKPPPAPACKVATYRNPAGERIIESELKKGSSREHYEQQLFRGVEVGLKGWERAHS